MVQALLRVGLSTTEVRDWIAHPNRAYPHDWPMDMLGNVMTLKEGSMWLIERGHVETLLAGVRGCPVMVTAASSTGCRLAKRPRFKPNSRAVRSIRADSSKATT